MVAAAIDKARPAIYRWVPYILVVVAASVGAYLASQQAIEKTATIAYYNAVDGCERANLILAPSHDYFVAVASDPDTAPIVRREALAARNQTLPRSCLSIIQKVGPADDYVPPEAR